MFKRISIVDAKVLLDQGEAQLVDIRDEHSYRAGHIPSATHLHQSNLQHFIESSDLTKPVLVCCYHGNSSQSAAEMLNTKGFEQSYSIDGGFEAWKLQFPVER